MYTVTLRVISATPKYLIQLQMMYRLFWICIAWAGIEEIGGVKTRARGFVIEVVLGLK